MHLKHTLQACIMPPRHCACHPDRAVTHNFHAHFTGKHSFEKLSGRKRNFDVSAQDAYTLVSFEKEVHEAFGMAPDHAVLHLYAWPWTGAPRP